MGKLEDDINNKKKKFEENKKIADKIRADKQVESQKFKIEFNFVITNIILPTLTKFVKMINDNKLELGGISAHFTQKVVKIDYHEGFKSISVINEKKQIVAQLDIFNLFSNNQFTDEVKFNYHYPSNTTIGLMKKLIATKDNIYKINNINEALIEERIKELLDLVV
jgi:hypothetical protein